MGKTIENKPSEIAPSPPPESVSKKSTEQSQKPARKKKHRVLRFLGYSILTIIILVLCIRPMLPWAVRWYVNKTLDRSLIYEGRIGDVTLNLWRGAYSISNIRLVKRIGDVPTPLFKTNNLELAIQWNAILHGKIVGQVVMDHPVINFVDSSDDSESQTGAGGPWLQTLAKLFPFDLNSAQIHDGAIHFRSYKSQKPVDVYLSNIEGSVDDLTNISDVTTPMLTTIHAKALAMNQAKFELNMKMNPFSYRPTFQLATRLIGLDVTQINDLALTYGRFDFKRGWFDLVIEIDCTQGEIQGYVKPLFRDLKVFDLVDDVKNDNNPLQFFWQALLGATTTVLSNQSRDQFGTLIPFTGDMSQPNADLLSTLGNILRNAFIRAYLPKLQNGTEGFDGMQFGPPSITDPSSIGDNQ